MTRKPCPPQSDLLAFADAELSPERLQRVEQHLEGCSQCAAQVLTLTRLIDDLAAPVGPATFDVAAHVEGVMKRIDAPAHSPSSGRVVLAFALVASVLAAAAALLLFFSNSEQRPVPGQLAARGGPQQPTLSRDVGVQLYAQTSELRALSAGASIRGTSSLTAGLRNTGQTPAYLLLFAVDAKGVVHWIAPEFTLPGSNPRAISVAPAAEERLLPTAAVFDDLAAGALRVVALLSSEPSSVADIEALTAEQLGSQSLARRFPRAEVRELVLHVTPGAP